MSVYPNLVIGADHGGVELKDALVAWLRAGGREIADVGTHGGESVDYPDFAHAVADVVAGHPERRGILVCTTGIGVCIAANKTPGIRAATVHTTRQAEMTRRHNNANVLCLSGAETDLETAKAILEVFLSTAFEDGGRHERRVRKIGGRPLAEVDPEIFAAVRAERKRQAEGIELIASENFASAAVMEAQGSCLTNKYAEGYPGKRWYGGCENVDEAERLAISRAKELFGAAYANVQPHSGSQANAAVYFALIGLGDRILTMDLSHGGHLTHGHPANFSGKFYEVKHYGVSAETGRIDYDLLEQSAREFRPKMITAGASAYSRIIDFARMREIADAVGAILFVDMAHIAGLVAAGVHPSPMAHAHVVTTTTHKSLRGPRGGLILTNDEETAKKLDSLVFPGIQGGPLMHVIAAKAVCFHEALQPGFRDYQRRIVANARALADRMAGHGYRLLSGGTDNHLFLVDLRPNGLNGKTAQETLDEAAITVNKNSIPYDTENPFRGGGIRIGTPAVTTRGMNEAEMAVIGDWIHDALTHRDDKGRLHRIREQVQVFMRQFPLP
jgi:RpiB/LacA/LacB family sugar-phosphate isomerase